MLTGGRELQEVHRVLRPFVRGRHVLDQRMHRGRSALRLGGGMLQRGLQLRKMRVAQHELHDRREYLQRGFPVLLEALFERALSAELLVLHPDWRPLLARLRLLLRSLQRRRGIEHRHLRGADRRPELL
jgi:hypothetical protein